MRSKMYSIIISCFIGLLLAGVMFAAAPQSGPPEESPIFKAKTIDYTSYIDANRIFMFVTNIGILGRDMAGVFGYDYGTFFPYTSIDNIENGSNISSPLYASGLWIGGQVNNTIRIAIAEYSSEYVPGPMAGGTYQPDNPAFKVYRLYSDSMASNPNSDYLNWPVDQGAPLDGSGHPLLRGEQTTWTVYNDADPYQHDNNSGETDPLGIEVHQMISSSNPVGSDVTVVPLTLPVVHEGTTSIEARVVATTMDVLADNEYMIIARRTIESGDSWDLINITTGELLLENQAESFYGPIQGLTITMDFGPTASWAYASAVPANISPVALETDPFYDGGRWFTGGEHGGDIFFGGIFMEPNFWGGTTVASYDIKPVEIRYRPMGSFTDLNGDGSYTIGEPYVVDDQGQAQNAFMYSSFDGGYYEGFYPVPFSAFDVSDPLNPRQLNVVIRDRDGNHAWDLHNMFDPIDPALPNDGDMRFNYCWILNTDYDPTGTYYGDGYGGTIDFWSADGYNSVYDGMWVLWFDDRGNGGMLAEEGTLQISPLSSDVVDTFTFTSKAPIVVTNGEENNSLYIEYKLYNKGGNTITDCYVSFWADPDLGELGDDLVGCDTLQNMFFCYNADNNDNQYLDRPPALGYKVIAGPLVPSNGDTAVFGNNHFPNFANLGMSAFAKYINGTDPDNYQQTYNYMRGLNADGSPYWNGTTFMDPGDPVAGTGELDTAPSDKRMMASFGPFDFNPGDSQYVLLKMSVGQAGDRLSSSALMKEYLNFIPSDEPDDPYTLKAQVIPDPQYVLFRYAIEPIMDTIIFGRTGADITDVDFASLQINGAITPTEVGYLPSYEGFGGQVVRMIFPAAEFLESYGDIFDLQSESYIISCQLEDGYFFTHEGTFRLRGHASGDANGDGHINLADAIFIVSYAFRDGPSPETIWQGDANGDQLMNVGDAVYLINYIFRGGPPPVE